MPVLDSLRLMYIRFVWSLPSFVMCCVASRQFMWMDAAPFMIKSQFATKLCPLNAISMTSCVLMNSIPLPTHKKCANTVVQMMIQYMQKSQRGIQSVNHQKINRRIPLSLDCPEDSNITVDAIGGV